MCGWPVPQDETKKKPKKPSRKSRLISHVIASTVSPISAYDINTASEPTSIDTPNHPDRLGSGSRTPSLNPLDPAIVSFFRTYQPLFGQPQHSVYGALAHPTSRILFEYYYHKTASHVSAHPQNFNPFIKQLMPWAVSNDLILQSLLAWSGSHLSIISTEVKETTCLHYAQAIRGIKYGLTKHAAGEEDVVMQLLISTLMLCFIEVSHIVSDKFTNETPAKFSTDH